MYGFLLTIYLLVRFFGIDQAYLNANLWSTLLGYGETGMMISMILGYAILFAGIGIFIEGWREARNARCWINLARNTAPTGFACPGSFRAGVNGESWSQCGAAPPPRAID